MIYFDTNKVKSIESIGYKKNGNAFRFYLKIETNCNSADKAIVVMKNPAKACINNLCAKRKLHIGTNIESDLTVNNVIKNLGIIYNEIIILNLYPLMDSNTKNVKNFYTNSNKIVKSTTDRNRNTIIQTIKKDPRVKIFCAWGQNSYLPLGEYANNVCKFLDYFKKRNIYLGEFDSAVSGLWKPITQIFPLHASKW